MPPPRLPPRRGAGRGAVVGGLLAVVASAVTLWWVVRFASENPEKANLGDPVFEVGRAERLAREVAAGGPFLFQDPLSRGRGRNVYLQHLGDDPDRGWVAVEARLPHEPTCVVRWQQHEAAFVDCRGSPHPPDGRGLTTYPATVEAGMVQVDLRRPRR